MSTALNFIQYDLILSKNSTQFVCCNNVTHQAKLYFITMIEALITSKTRIKLLLKFFLNSERMDYLRNLETELGEHTHAIRTELNKLEKAGLLRSFTKGNKKYFKSNLSHPLFSDIQSILLKVTGIDELIKRVLNNVGDLKQVYLTGELARGNNVEIIDLLVVGNIKHEYFYDLVLKAEIYIKKKIRFVVFTEEEFEFKKQHILGENDLLIWEL